MSKPIYSVELSETPRHEICLVPFNFSLSPSFQFVNEACLDLLRTLDNTTCNTILSFNMLRRRPAMHIEGFNMHALEEAINIARSISIVAVAAICIDKTNIFLTSPAICIVLTIRWSMSNAIHIAVYNIATMCASMHITPINMIVFNTYSTYCHIRCIA